MSPGPEGRREFVSEVKRLLGRGGGEGDGGADGARAGGVGPDVDVVFEIKIPATGARGLGRPPARWGRGARGRRRQQQQQQQQRQQ